jgi:hypothetical protein
MPEWLKRKLEEGGVKEPYALMNAAGIMHGSKTVVEGEEEVKKKLSAYMKARAFMKKHGKKGKK